MEQRERETKLSENANKSVCIPGPTHKAQLAAIRMCQDKAQDECNEYPERVRISSGRA